MSTLQLLIVEDDEQDLERCRVDVENYRDDTRRNIEIVECKTFDEALEKLDNSYDGAIIDLKLTSQGVEGIEVIKEIRKLFFRIPIFIFTGNPDIRNESIKGIEVFLKGETRYYNLIDQLWDTYETGLTRMMGGAGRIEELLGKVFLENLLLQRERWVSYGKADLERTENALLRYTLDHLLQLLGEDNKPRYPEEVYIYPHLSNKITTGSIVREKTTNSPFIVLSPACDLVIRNDDVSKTDRILIAEIEEECDIVENALDGFRKRDRINKELVAVANNNREIYYHWLPKTDFFDGGFLNFRKVNALTKDEFDDSFELPEIQISSSFVKDIVARFSSFYARQGQPDIDSADFVNQWTAPQGETQ